MTRTSRGLGLSTEEQVMAVLRYFGTHELGVLTPQQNRNIGGAPRRCPNYTFVLYLAAADIFGSARAAASHFEASNFALWRRLQSESAVLFTDETMHLPDIPPTLAWYQKFRARYALHEHYDLVEDYRNALMPIGVRTAVEIGHEIDTAGRFDIDDKSRRISADGKVLAPPTFAAAATKKVTRHSVAPNPDWVGDPDDYDDEDRFIVIEHGEDEVPEYRYDPDTREHTTGDKRVVTGNKFWHASIRGDRPFERVILAIDYVGDEKGKANSEEHVQMKNFRELHKRAPGIVGVNTDGVSRGVHLNEMQREFGWAPASPITADRIDGDVRIEKEGPVGEMDFSDLGCKTPPVPVWHQGGWLAKRVFPADKPEGELVRLEWLRGLRRNNARQWRTYVEYRITCECGQHEKVLCEPTYNRPEDTKAGFNRAENIRMIPPGSETYTKVYPRRSDAESINRGIDDRLPLRRARSYGWRGQLLDLIGHAIAVNAIAHERFAATTVLDKRSVEAA